MEVAVRRILAVLLVGLLTTPAYAAEDPVARRRRIEHELARTQTNLGESTAAVQDAATALGSVAVELPRAQARFADVTGRLSAARAAAAAAAAAVSAADAGV